MSTPAGQSLEQALQDRQRSSDSRTSGAFQPPVIRRPFAISCSVRARPRVTSFSSFVAWYDGHMKPPASPLAARHLPTPCLLYTSDAADDLLCVDLGGRRIIKKKKK